MNKSKKALFLSPNIQYSNIGLYEWNGEENLPPQFITYGLSAFKKALGDDGKYYYYIDSNVNYGTGMIRLHSSITSPSSGITEFSATYEVLSLSGTQALGTIIAFVNKLRQASLSINPTAYSGTGLSTNYPPITLGEHTLKIVINHTNNTFSEYIDGVLCVADKNQYSALDVSSARCSAELWHTSLGKGRLKAVRYNHVDHNPLSYIQCSGVSWINLGVMGRSGLKVEMKVLFVNLYTAYFFGSRAGTNSGCFNMLVGTNVIRSDYYNSISAVSPTLSTNTEYVIKKLNNKQYLNDVEFGSYAEATFDTGYDMYMFGTNGSSPRTDALSIRLYYLKIWDENNVLLRDFIPVVKSGGINCLYDNVSKTYFYNQGTGSFIGA